MIDWPHHARHLADHLVDTGAADPTWADVVSTIPRHELVPSFYRQSADLGGWERLSAADPATRSRWAAEVYADRTLVTALREQTDQFGTFPVPISSSTLPSLMLRMLRRLDLPGATHAVEIGTGCGYNAALLCARLGDRLVSSIDIEADLIELARQRLDRMGLRPELRAEDSATASLPGFDRLIATCAVATVPAGWLDAARPGAVLLVPTTGPLADGALIRLTVGADGRAEGRFLPLYAGFMAMRSTRAVAVPSQPVEPAGVETRPTRVDPVLLDARSPFAFLAQQSMPELGPRRIGMSPEGSPVAVLSMRDGSCARVARGPDHSWTVAQRGPTDIWTPIERTYQRWTALGCPGWDRFGLTVTGGEQRIWLDSPANRVGQLGAPV